MRDPNTTWVEINLSALAHNLSVVRSLVGEGVDILVPVKANGYGHGMVEVSRAAIQAEAKMLGVATVSEGIQLKQAGIKSTILVLDAILADDVEKAAESDLMLTLFSDAIARNVIEVARKLQKKVSVHVDIDTGMGRIGFAETEAVDAVARLSKEESLDVRGVYTHLPSASVKNDPFTRGQIARFLKIKAQLESRGVRPRYFHAASSPGIVNYPQAHLDMVRPGLMTYGMATTRQERDALNLHPVMSFRTRIAHLYHAPAGRCVSYLRTYSVPKDTLIATLPVGYSDGYNFKLSNRGEVIIKGHRCPVVGRVCMDMTMVDVGHVPHVSVGDMVTLIGKDGDEEISAEDMATLADTIPYVVTTGISGSVPGVFVEREQGNDE